MFRGGITQKKSQKGWVSSGSFKKHHFLAFVENHEASELRKLYALLLSVVRP